jgi:hypothetical protein
LPTAASWIPQRPQEAKKLRSGNGFFNFALIVALQGATILQICTKKTCRRAILAARDAS